MRSKQKTLHRASPIFVGGAVCLALWVSCIGLPRQSLAADGVARADPPPLGSADRLGDQMASLRLIGEAGLSNGRYRAGVEIAMQAGAHTYWRQPGDAGVPPVFSFNGSRNVAKADVLFPAPRRIDESGLEALGYLDRVVFPVLVTPADPGQPALLKVEVSYAVCRKLCVPAHNTATITLRPDGRGVAGDKVAAAIRDVPVPMTPAERRSLSIAPIKGTPKQSWALTWSGTAPVEDMFADAPEGFYFETKRLSANTYQLVATQTVTAAKRTSVPVVLTLARKIHSLATTETFDIGSPTN